MSDLIDRQALRAAHGLGADCHDCKRDMKSCQYDRDYSLMDFCEWLDDAPTASPWHRVEDGLPVKGEIVIVSDGKRTWDVGQYRCLAFSDGDRTKWWWKGHTIKTVKWWMRKKDALPEPPKEDA